MNVNETFSKQKACNKQHDNINFKGLKYPPSAERNCQAKNWPHCSHWQQTIVDLACQAKIE